MKPLDRLSRSADKDGKQDKSAIKHSKAYHRFFEGYSEYSVMNANGKGTSIQRIYTGNYYRQDLTRGRRILLRAAYLWLFLGALYLFVSSAIQPLASNSTWFVVLPQAVSIPLLFWMVIAFITYMPAGRDMTIDDYRSSSLALKKASLFSAISLGATALATLIFMALNPSDQPLAELLCAAKFLAGGLFVFSIDQVERRLHYLVIPSPNKPPEDAYEIK